MCCLIKEDAMFFGGESKAISTAFIIPLQTMVQSNDTWGTDTTGQISKLLVHNIESMGPAMRCITYIEGPVTRGGCWRTH